MTGREREADTALPDTSLLEPTTFDVLSALPTGTTVLEASAGTGKTWTIGALVTRYVAEGRVDSLEQMLVVTFGRAASQELRERVRAQLVEAERALARALGDPSYAATLTGPDDTLLAHLVATDVPDRHKRVVQALASFDGATIATTHQFCQLVLRSLGVAGDTDGTARLVEDLDDLTVEVTEDLFLREFGHLPKPPFPMKEALALARKAIGDPQARLVPDPEDPPPAGEGRLDPEGLPARRRAFAAAVRHEVEHRKQRRGVLSYDDLLSRLADALEESAPESGVDPPAAQRMRQRWRVVLVDEFQDTDPVQWRVLHRAFTGHATLILVGDPKQAIYAFRGGDIDTYLHAAGTATDRRTLAVNRRSDAPLVDSLQVLTQGAALGDPRIAVLPVTAHHRQARLAVSQAVDGRHRDAPMRVRVIRTEGRKVGRSGALSIGDARAVIAEDLADDVASLLASGPSYDDPGAADSGPDGRRPLRAGDIAVLMHSLNQAEPIREALRERGIASVRTSGGNVLSTPAALEWLTLLEALESQRADRVRALALTSFVGCAPSELDRGGDALTDRVADQARSWLDLFRSRGLAAVHEAAQAAGLAARVLSRPDGERRLTDSDHLAQLLHEHARRERLGLPALLEWYRAERRAVVKGERTRRLDTDADAVQFVTLHGSKGLQYPVVLLPHLFDRWVADDPVHLFHDAQGRRSLDVGSGKDSPHAAQAAHEAAAEELRLTYVALTRAQSQVVAWFAPTSNARQSGLTRLLFGRGPGQSSVPDRAVVDPADDAVATRLGRWAEAGAFALETVTSTTSTAVGPAADHTRLDARTFDSERLDETWRRTSYSSLIRGADHASVVTSDAEAGRALSEPEVEGTTDEASTSSSLALVGLDPRPDEEAILSPMAELPGGATFGSLVHAVLEHTDPDAPDLLAELRTHVADQRRWWPVDTPTPELAEALLPMQRTPLGPLAADLTLAEIPLRDRLRELDFEIPLAGGDRGAAGQVALRAIADLLRTRLDADDPMRLYADRVEAPGLGDQLLRGYLSGSVDAVLRVPGPDDAGERFVVVDYKTNRLGAPDRPLTSLDYTQPLMTEAMLSSHYPLQALLYSAVLHRYLRWRLPSYDAERHLGGILYLYVRGMCGPETPVVDGQPCGVFAWSPPASLVVALSDLLAGVRP